MASSGLFHTGSRPHDCCRVDLSATATMMASSDLFHNATTNHVPTPDDLGATATRYNVLGASSDLFHDEACNMVQVPLVAALLLPDTMSMSKNGSYLT